jgi:hypothetical protein
MIKETPGMLLHYETIGEFMYQYHNHLLREEHLAQRGQKNIPKFREPGNEDFLELDFWGYWFIKDGVNYIISSTDEDDEEVSLDDLIPVEAHDIQKLADTKGEVYMLVRKPITRRILPEQRCQPKEFIDKLSCIAHSNPRQQKLLLFQVLSQLWDRSYYRVASPASFGKDSVVDVCSALFGGCGLVENPTIAKLEDRATMLKLLVGNEVVGIPKANWQIIEDFLLPAACHKNFITKHSRAFKNVGELINIRNLSISLFYNDIDHYPDKDGEGYIPYFDATTKRAVRNRFPAFRFYGGFTEDFNAVARINTKKYVKDHWEDYISLIKSFEFYKLNYHDYMTGFNSDKLMLQKGRDATNMGRLLKIIDFYCDTQEEFDSWMETINDSMIDYLDMLKYPKLEYRLKKKLSEKEFDDKMKEVQKIDTFTARNIEMERAINGETVVGKRDIKELEDFGIV